MNIVYAIPWGFGGSVCQFGYWHMGGGNIKIFGDPLAKKRKSVIMRAKTTTGGEVYE